MSESRAGSPADDQTLHAQASPMLEGYVLDALEADETAIVDAHLDEGCVDCENDVGALRQIMGWIPLGAPLYDAGAGLKQRILGEIDESDTTEQDTAKVGADEGSWLTRALSRWRGRSR